MRSPHRWKQQLCGEWARLHEEHSCPTCEGLEKKTRVLPLRQPRRNHYSRYRRAETPKDPYYDP